MKPSFTIFIACVFICACKRPEPSSALNIKKKLPVKDPSQSFTAQGKPNSLQLNGSTLFYCNATGKKAANLETGTVSAVSGACLLRQPNNECPDSPLQIEVRTPSLGPDDILEVESYSYPLKGLVSDCSVDGKRILVASGGNVELIDAVKNSAEQLNSAGGFLVAINHRYVAWSTGKTVEARMRPKGN